MHVLRSNFKKVAVGLSGGVDSAVSALLLKKKGFEVTGVFMKNWDSLDETGNCTYASDLEDAEWLCSKLNISLKVVDFVKDYWNDVFVRFINEYTKGFTPNPDIWCNKHVKFNKFPEYVLHNLECDAVATGHYANSSFGNFLESHKENEYAHLLKAEDCLKDQTFFLCLIPQLALRRTMFPIGNLFKSEVKKIAKENMLYRILKRKESMGICFIGSRNFKEFISEYVESSSGRVISLDSGEELASHSGVHHWTVGERYRISGFPRRTYIISKCSETQDLYVGSGQDHPALHILGLQTSVPHWICDVSDSLMDTYSLGSSVFECDFRFQHAHPLRKCCIFQSSDGGLIVNFEKPLSSVSAGQFIVFYKGSECIGGAQIIKTGPSLYTLGKTISDL